MAPHDDFRLELAADCHGPVVKLFGDLDPATSPHLDRCLRGLTGRVVTLDFSGVTFMDCSTISVLVAVQERMRDDAAKLILFGFKPLHLRLLSILGLTNHFDSLIPN
jgi:anti-anti-sigma factor